MRCNDLSPSGSFLCGLPCNHSGWHQSTDAYLSDHHWSRGGNGKRIEDTLHPKAIRLESGCCGGFCSEAGCCVESE